MKCIDTYIIVWLFDVLVIIIARMFSCPYVNVLIDFPISKLRSYDILQDNFEANGITPGGSYSVSDIQKALVDTLGGGAFLHCQGDNVLVEVNF